MPWYIGKRLLQMIPVFFGATFLIYAMVFLTPGDPIQALAGDKPLTPAVENELRERYNLDKPFLVQYLMYVGAIFQFDFGQTFSGRPVTAVLAEVFPVTNKLALMALVIETVFGIKLAVVPPTVGGNADFIDLIMPATVVGLVSFAYVLRLTRSSVAEAVGSDFVRTAYARGMSRREVIASHVLRNSLIPVVTFIGADLAALMGGAIITEGIFNIPGVGGLIFRSVTIGETPTVVSVVTVLVIIYMVANLLIDLLYAALDPRIRYA